MNEAYKGQSIAVVSFYGFPTTITGQSASTVKEGFFYFMINNLPNYTHAFYTVDGAREAAEYQVDSEVK